MRLVGTFIPSPPFKKMRLPGFEPGSLAFSFPEEILRKFCRNFYLGKVQGKVSWEARILTIFLFLSPLMKLCPKKNTSVEVLSQDL